MFRHTTARARSRFLPTEPEPHAFFADRPRGHVVGHRTGDPQPPSLAGRLRGHVVGHQFADLVPPSFLDRPRGHVVSQPVARHSGRR
jgi:hypothetical protein